MALLRRADGLMPIKCFAHRKLLTDAGLVFLTFPFYLN